MRAHVCVCVSVYLFIDNTCRREHQAHWRISRDVHKTYLLLKIYYHLCRTKPARMYCLEHLMLFGVCRWQSLLIWCHMIKISPFFPRRMLIDFQYVIYHDLPGYSLTPQTSSLALLFSLVTSHIFDTGRLLHRKRRGKELISRPY